MYISQCRFKWNQNVFALRNDLQRWNSGNKYYQYFE